VALCIDAREKAEAEEQASYHLLFPALMMSFLAFEAFGEWRRGIFK
jgi:hypothetical protein